MMTKSLLEQIVAMLLPEMGDAKDRKALVESALHGSSALQKIEWDGAAHTFTVQLVNQLDQYGEISTGKLALAALLEEVKSRVGTDRQARIDELLAQINASAVKPSAETVTDSLSEYRRARIAEWSKPRYQLDRRFVNLTLTLDRGENEQQRWHRVEEPPMKDLREALEKAKEHPALVLLGAPGSGKSTLLRRLQLDHCADALRDPKETDDRISFFIQLSDYKGKPGPRKWLTTAWAERYPELRPLETWLQKGRALLLLDALNEMQPQPGSSYAKLVGEWKTFTQQAARAGNRLVFSCRSLDYGAPLSSKELPVPLVNLQPMTAEQTHEFLRVYAPAHEQRIWDEMDGSEQFSLYQTPYFLKLLCEQVEAAGELPKGRASLFTGFIRKTLARETDGELFQPGALLSERDHRKMTRNDWRDPFDLPERGLLIPKLSHLAFSMQENGRANDGAQVRIEYDDACALLADERAEDIIKAGLAMNALDEAREEIAFFHQLLQEYFAARRLAKEPRPALVHIEWSVDKVSPTMEETLAGLADGDPLPPPPQTGWEETTLTAGPMAKDPQAFIRDLIPHNLPLAGRCAASPEAKISDGLKREIQQALIARTQDMKADPRARISAGEALGLIGDPRFELRSGPYGDYLAPPLVDIPGGIYPMGDDDSDYDVEKPAHTVELAPFQIGQFPVTNAEYKFFIDAGGYKDEQWWDTAEALAWLRGEASVEGVKEQWRDNRKQFQSWSEEYIRGLVTQNRITSRQAEEWITIRNWTDEEFERWLDELHPSGKIYHQPRFWDDSQFNNPSQPVVGLSWFEARAYCNWLTANESVPRPVGSVAPGLGSSRGAALTTGRDTDPRIYRLPTEAEFEAAARGKKGRMFPYEGTFDVNRSNNFESHIRRTTPVGIFNNATPEGAIDLSGNAYTWTLSIYDQERFPYPYRSDDGREDTHKTGVRRVLRGGAWFYGHVDARAVSRNLDHPAGRNFNIGFRVVCVARPTPLVPLH